MSRNHILLKILLFPFSLLYGVIVCMRNCLFNIGVLNCEKFNLPIISIGNITVGGTGKTPHTEYVISLLCKNNFSVAMLSRGYKRQTSGFVLADDTSDSNTIGDEPFQIKKKFKNIIVAVDKNRARAIDRLLEFRDKHIDVVVLDDAFQYRYINPDINILLIDYERLITKDFLLPVGNLREPAHNKKRANIVIITKCPDDLKPIDVRITTKELNLYPYQSLFFTQYAYFEPTPVFNDVSVRPVTKAKIQRESFDILLVTGIVSPTQIKNHLEKYTEHIHSLSYPDHHNFTQKDIETIETTFAEIKNQNKIIVTTEKDAARFLSIENLPKNIKKSLYYIPIEVQFLLEIEQKFKQIIIDYVKKNRPNSRFSEKQTADNT